MKIHFSHIRASGRGVSE